MIHCSNFCTGAPPGSDRCPVTPDRSLSDHPQNPGPVPTDRNRDRDRGRPGFGFSRQETTHSDEEDVWYKGSGDDTMYTVMVIRKLGKNCIQTNRDSSDVLRHIIKNVLTRLVRTIQSRTSVTFFLGTSFFWRSCKKRWIFVFSRKRTAWNP
jgi:hypothetical protein